MTFVFTTMLALKMINVLLFNIFIYSFMRLYQLKERIMVAHSFHKIIDRGSGEVHFLKTWEKKENFGITIKKLDYINGKKSRFYFFCKIRTRLHVGFCSRKNADRPVRIAKTYFVIIFASEPFLFFSIYWHLCTFNILSPSTGRKTVSSCWCFFFF